MFSLNKYLYFYIFPETDDKKANTPLVTSPSTENISRFSFFRRNKTQSKSQDQSTEDEGNLIFVFQNNKREIKRHQSGKIKMSCGANCLTI